MSEATIQTPREEVRQMTETKTKGITGVGNHVAFVDSHGAPHMALVTAVHGPETESPSINLVIVDPALGSTDSYGRQLIRHTSVVHESNQHAHGMYWTNVA